MHLVERVASGIPRMQEAMKEAIINLLTATPGSNASEISKHLNKSLRTAMRYIKTLQDQDLIEFRGAPKNGGYFLKIKQK